MSKKNQSQDSGCSLKAPERNRYFYGKLLTVRDFETEQDYHVHMRRQMNRLVLGQGVVCGLGVTASADGTSLTVAPGVANDCCGREIVVPSATTRELSRLDGFTASASGDFHLCLAYDECDREPVPAPAATDTCEEVCEYGRIQESFKLSLISPRQDGGQARECGLLGDPVEFFRGSFGGSPVSIARRVPRWVAPGELFEVQLILKGGSAGAPALQVAELLSDNLELPRTMFPPVPMRRLTVAFPATAPGLTLEVSYMLRAGDAPGQAAVQAVSVTGTDLSGEALDVRSALEIVEGSITDRVVDRLFRQGRIACPECEEEHRCLVLAAVRLQAGSIVAIDPFPTSEFVYNNRLLYELLACAEKKIGPQGPSGPPGRPGPPGAPGRPGPGAVGGTVRVESEDGRGRVIVDTGLGHSDFCVCLGDDLGEFVRYGPPEPEDEEPTLLIARVLKEGEPGRFVIEVFSRRQAVQVAWTAVPAGLEVEPTITVPTPTIPTTATLPTPTVTVPTPTLTVPTPTFTITIPTATLPTLTRPTETLPTLTRPTIFTLPTETLPTLTRPTETLPTLTRPTIFTLPTETLPTLTRPTGVFTQPTAIFTLPTGTLPTQPTVIATVTLPTQPTVIATLPQPTLVGPTRIEPTRFQPLPTATLVVPTGAVATSRLTAVLATEATITGPTTIIEPGPVVRPTTIVESPTAVATPVRRGIDLREVEGIGDSRATALEGAGIDSAEALAEAAPERVARALDLSEDSLTLPRRLIAAARERVREG